MDALANLLEFYGIEDPVKRDETGIFSDKTIGDLFLQLSTLGSISKMEALLVGGYIEEYDIWDIWKAYQETDELRIQKEWPGG